MKRSNLTQKVKLKVTLTAIVVTVVCLLPLMAVLHGLRETQGMVIYQVFSIYFHYFEYNWFVWLLAAIQEQRWLLICSSGVCLSSKEIVLRAKNAKKSSEEKSSNNNEQLPYKGNEIMTELYTNRTMCQFQVLEETVLWKKQLWKANSVKAQ